MRDRPAGRGRWGSQRFPGEAEWRWHIQEAIERRIAPIRAAVVAANLLAWFHYGRPFFGGVVPPALVAALASGYALADLAVVYRFPQVSKRYPNVPTFIDCCLILVWILSTGARRSPFVDLVLVGVVSAPLRLPVPTSLLLVLLYSGFYALVAGPGALLTACYLVLAGLAQCVWTTRTYAERRESLRDTLTGCFGREYGLFRLQELLDSGELPFSIGLVDLDGFKGVNDRLGHPTGDVVLTACTRLIARVIRPSDLLARFGGDEFLVVWPEMSCADACAAGDRIRTSIEGTPLHVRTSPEVIRLTASVGVVEAGAGASAAALLQAADAALYRAKEGRNRVAWSVVAGAGDAGDDPPPPPNVLVPGSQAPAGGGPGV
jgi:diguanylate cyclase (GGDEF)-like protein